MKKITTILFLLLNFITIDSQTVEMLSGDPEWYYWMTYDLHDGMVSHDYFLAYGVHGTMELNGRCYHTMYWLNRAYIDWGGEVYAPEFPVYVREANGIVYADYESYANAAKEQGYNEPCPYKKTDDGEIILYDFTLKAGDKYPTAPEVDPIFVNDIKAITTLDGIERKLFCLSNGLDILEGIGCINSRALLVHYLYSTAPRYYLWSDWDVNSYVLFLCEYKRNNNSIYYNNSPNTTTSIERIHKDMNYLHRPIYFDLQGRRLTQKPTKGVYIQDGKKVMVK